MFIELFFVGVYGSVVTPCISGHESGSDSINDAAGDSGSIGDGAVGGADCVRARQRPKRFHIACVDVAVVGGVVWLAVGVVVVVEVEEVVVVVVLLVEQVGARCWARVGVEGRGVVGVDGGEVGGEVVAFFSACSASLASLAAQ